MINIVIADDHPLMRQGVRRLLEQQPDMRVVGEAADGRHAIALVADQEVDVLLLDLSLPRVNGMEVLRRIVEERPRVRVLVLSMYPAEQYEAQLLEMGAAAYVSKDAPPEDLLAALRRVGAGAAPTSKRGASTGDARAPHKSLTAREYQVFTLIFQGQTVTDIAAELDLSSSTVSNHLAKIKDKLGVRSVGEMVRYALEAGLAGRPRGA